MFVKVITVRGEATIINVAHIDSISMDEPSMMFRVNIGNKSILIANESAQRLLHAMTLINRKTYGDQGLDLLRGKDKATA